MAHSSDEPSTVLERRLEPNMKTVFSRFLKDESGATAIEYSLIAALIGVAVIAAVKSLGLTLSSKFSNITANLT